MAQLAELGLTDTGKLSFSPQLADVLQGADFVQENAPEKEELKQQLLADIDDLLPPEVIYDLPTGGKRIMQKARGYRHTFVSGVETLCDDTPTGALPGQLVRS